MDHSFESGQANEIEADGDEADCAQACLDYTDDVRRRQLANTVQMDTGEACKGFNFYASEDSEEGEWNAACILVTIILDDDYLGVDQGLPWKWKY